MTISWGTYDTAPGHFENAESGLIPETKILPSSGAKTPKITSTRVVLPAPEGPTIATMAPSGIFKDIPQDYVATRYHSLAIEEAGFPEVLEVTARSESGVIMGVKHKTLPIEGVQFHPESILTEHGHKLLQNWLNQFSN